MVYFAYLLKSQIIKLIAISDTAFKQLKHDKVRETKEKIHT